MSTGLQTGDPRYVGPSFDAACVHDAMRIGVVTCRPETSLPDVARMMASYKIHSVVVAEADSPPFGIVSAIDIATAPSDPSELTAADVATTELVAVSSNETLQRAAWVMADHGVTHLLAVDPDTGSPVGVISASGLVAALAAPHS
jgi:CBS domain-containing protein